METLLSPTAIHSTELINALNWRYATKIFDKNKKVPGETIDALLEVLRLSPSSIGLQPWKFILIKDEHVRRQIRDLSMDQSQITDASHLLLLCALNDMDVKYIDKLITYDKEVCKNDRSAYADFRPHAVDYINAMPKPQLREWMAEQTYIALAKEWKQLHRDVFGPEFYQHRSDPASWLKILDADDRDIWKIRKKLKKDLLDAIRSRIGQEMAARHEAPKKTAEVLSVLQDEAFVIGFARRVTAYKRPGLLFTDPERLERILGDVHRPVLLLVAGKAHPNDENGLNLIKQLSRATENEVFKHRVIFLEDYDINLARLLIQGADLWLNMPNRQMEACGTSGMKAIMNGVVNFSVLDGWWAEAYTKDAGWALSEEPTYENEQFQDELDAAYIYQALENEIIPLYFKRNNAGIPEGWLRFIKNAIALAPAYTMTRALADYRNTYYNKLETASQKMRVEQYSMAKKIAGWKQHIRQQWKQIDVISINEPDQSDTQLTLPFKMEIILDIGLLSVNEIGLDIVMRATGAHNKELPTFSKEFSVAAIDGSRVSYECLLPELQSGNYEYGFRVFARNPELPYRQDTGIVTWI